MESIFVSNVQIWAIECMFKSFMPTKCECENHLEFWLLLMKFDLLISGYLAMEISYDNEWRKFIYSTIDIQNGDRADECDSDAISNVTKSKLWFEWLHLYLLAVKFFQNTYHLMRAIWELGFIWHSLRAAVAIVNIYSTTKTATAIAMKMMALALLSTIFYRRPYLSFRTFSFQWNAGKRSNRNNSHTISLKYNVYIDGVEIYVL